MTAGVAPDWRYPEPMSFNPEGRRTTDPKEALTSCDPVSKGVGRVKSNVPLASTVAFTVCVDEDGAVMLTGGVSDESYFEEP